MEGNPFHIKLFLAIYRRGFMKISVVVPIYNIEKYIEKCLLSIINQTYKDIEIILVNDESQDMSLTICNQYKEKDSRIIIINKKNGGLSDARNYGIQKATGEYILLVDGDDYLESTACEELVNIATKTEADLIAFNYNRIQNNIKKSFSKNTEEIQILSVEETYKRYLYGENIFPAAWTKFYNKKLFKEITFPFGLLAEDFATTHKFILSSHTIVYYDKALYNYLIREDGIMGKKSLKLTIDYYYSACEKYNMEIEKFPQFSNQINTLYVNCLLRTIARLSLENHDQAIIDEITERLENINLKDLKLSTRFVYYLYNFNEKLFCNFMKFMKKTV